MKKKVGVKFKPTGKVYDFSCGAFVLNPGDHVIVETEQGLGMGTVTVGPQEYKDKSSGRPLKKVYPLKNPLTEISIPFFSHPKDVSISGNL